MANVIVEKWRKKPLEVGAVFFGTDPTDFYGEELKVPDEDVHIIWMRTPLLQGYHVYNPGTKHWLPLSEGCYIIVAPTGCRYPVSGEQFKRNYEQPAEAEVTSKLDKVTAILKTRIEDYAADWDGEPQMSREQIVENAYDGGNHSDTFSSGETYGKVQFAKRLLSIIERA